MKKTVLCTLFIAVSLIANAQLTELHTFPVFGISWQSYNGALPAAGYHYSEINSSGRWTYYVYNWDFTLNRTLSITPPSGYKVYSVLSMSKNYINDDDKIEMFVTYEKINYTDNNTQNKLQLINEDGTVLQDFGSAYYWHGGSFHSYNNETRVTVAKQTYTNGTATYSTIIYRCAGPGQVSIPEVSQETITLGNAYPNPTTNTVTLPYHLSSNNTSEIHIYNTSGKLVQTVSVGPHFNEVLIDVSSFPSGLYIYECEGKTSKFVVK